MEDEKSLEHKNSDCILNESENHETNATLEDLPSNMKDIGKEQTAVAKETKENPGSFSGGTSKKSFEELTWRNRGTGRNKDKEITRSNIANLSVSSHQCSWRSKKGANTVPTLPRAGYGVNLERRNLFGTGQSLRGNWCFRCDNHERNSDGLTEADTIWAAVNELFEKEPSVFFLKPEKFPSREGLITINCYTTDYKDEEFILKTANVLKQHVYYPYVMYYFKSSAKSQSIYMHTPNGEFYKKNENNIWVIADRE